MPYLIDGNNLIGVMREIDLKDSKGREKLTQLLGPYSRSKGNKVTVVYDGPPPDGVRPTLHIGSVKVIYAGPESDADTKIKSLVKKAVHPGSIIVVSSDKQVFSFCKWAGAQAMQSRAFYQDLKSVLENIPSDADQKNRLSSAEVDEWLDYFGVEDD